MTARIDSAGCAGGGVHLAGLATASPPLSLDQRQVGEFLAAGWGHQLRPGSMRILRRVLAHPGVRRRSFALDGTAQLAGETRDGRVERFTRWAVDLAAEAAGQALGQAGARPGDVSVLSVNTCTGYVCPGLTSYLIERLGLPSGVRAFDLVGAGCGGAIPNLEMAGAALAAAGRGRGAEVALCVSTEICSAAFRMGDDPSLIVSNALFADGAAAAVLRRGPGRLRLADSASLHLPRHREAIRFVHRDGELHNQLSPELPALVGRALARLVPGFLARNGLAVGDVSCWAVHPGGEKVLAAAARALGLPDEALASSRAVLAEQGNLSSATVWFVLRRLLDASLPAGEPVVMLAFGAGLSAHACLLVA